MRGSVRGIAIVLAGVLLLGLTVSCDKEGSELRFDYAQYAVAAGDPVQLKFVAEERKNTGCMLHEQEVMVADQTQHVESWRVEPAEGATVDSSGKFTATEPGEYTVTAVFSGNAYTTKVVVDDEGGTTVEEPEEAEPEGPEVSPLVGTWEFAPYHAAQPAGVSTWQWVTDDSRMRFTITQAADGVLSIAGILPGTTMSVSGDNVSIEQPMGDANHMIRLEGTVSGNAITGTQSYDYINIGTFSAEWVATRVQ